MSRDELVEFEKRLSPCGIAGHRRDERRRGEQRKGSEVIENGKWAPFAVYGLYSQPVALQWKDNLRKADRRRADVGWCAVCSEIHKAVEEFARQKLDPLEAENQRLREALRSAARSLHFYHAADEISGAPPIACAVNDFDSCPNPDCAERRAALAGKATSSTAHSPASSRDT